LKVGKNKRCYYKNEDINMIEHHSVLIVGGGAAGVSVANNLRRKDKTIDIAIIEPSEKHYYQAAFTIVGGGEYTLEQATRNEADLIPSSIKWIRGFVETFQPEENNLTLRSGEVLNYTYLVVCPGFQLDWHKIDGLKDALGRHGVCSNYSPETVEYTWECIQAMQSGRALFTQPVMPIKCAGAPQKIMYMAADRFRKKGIAKEISVEFYNVGGAMFGIPFFAKPLANVAESYGIKTHFGYNLVAIDGEKKLATFEVTDSAGNKSQVTESFDMIHVTPPQSAPDFIKQSPLANADGRVDVHPNTLQHNKYTNIFGLGDAASTTNAKTAAAVRKQVPVVVDNILQSIKSEPLKPGYDGYGSCPLVTSLNTVLLAEFSYDNRITPSFPFLDPRKSRWIWWLGKKIGFPWLYWDLMLKGNRIDIPHKESYAKKFIDHD
jgi:sulfide:quinone oxidoreductase